MTKQGFKRLLLRVVELIQRLARLRCQHACCRTLRWCSIILTGRSLCLKKMGNWGFLPPSQLRRKCVAGKFPGGFMKREGRRPSTDATLTALSLIDRPIRPICLRKVSVMKCKVINTVLSYDENASANLWKCLQFLVHSLALSISDIPFDGTNRWGTSGHVDDQIINPTKNKQSNRFLNWQLQNPNTLLTWLSLVPKNCREETAALLKDMKPAKNWLPSIKKSPCW